MEWRSHRLVLKTIPAPFPQRAQSGKEPHGPHTSLPHQTAPPPTQVLVETYHAVDITFDRYRGERDYYADAG